MKIHSELFLKNQKPFKSNNENYFQISYVFDTPRHAYFSQKKPTNFRAKMNLESPKLVGCTINPSRAFSLKTYFGLKANPKKTFQIIYEFLMSES